MSAPRPAARMLFARLKLNLRTGTDRLRAAISPLRAELTEKAGKFLSGLRRTIAAGHARTRDAYAAFTQRCLTGFSALRRDLSAIRRNLLAPLARIWAAANSEVELPQISLAPFFRVASVLFAVTAIGIAGFTAWQTIPVGQKADELAFAALGDHHPPIGGSAMGLPAPGAVVFALDAESEFVILATGPEDDMTAPGPRIIDGISDIDAERGYEVATIEPEEELPDALYPSPRPRTRPDIPQPPMLSGIPIQPELPMGTAPSQPAWLANAVEVRRLGNGPMIAIVIDDAGVVQPRTRRASELPAPITIAFIPYSDNLERQARYARSRGHELLLHIPMEPGGGDADPGYNALLTSLGQEEIMRRFRWALDRFDGYVGVNNHMGSKFMARSDLVRPVLEETNARGLLFLDSRTDHRTVGTGLARDMGMPHATRNVFLDNDLDAAKIRAQLAELERVARRRGQAIAIGHPHDLTVDVLAEWIPEARRKGFTLVPVSAIVKKEYGPRLASAAAGGESYGLFGGAQ
ncbi:MAG: divergent polysaccharide deacetylase family protein [Proteobacteria bacterium]|nr:divergent polysaccharide deacetylase family protein [Pseudomonadota bacterium]